MSRDVSACPHRIVDEGSRLVACGLLAELAGCAVGPQVAVERAACEACCRGPEPSAERLNSVVASLAFDLARRLAAADDAAGAELARLVALRDRALTALEPARRDSSLRDLYLAPQRRGGERVTTWAVGVTTAPREVSTLDRCLDSLARAGWPEPHLFVDEPVALSERSAWLPATRREPRVGAWPNYILALHELLMREPRADAFMLVQDDALFYDRDDLRGYLEADVLWPDRGDGPGIVSLYCSSAHMKDERGWHTMADRWGWGALAFVFPNALARKFVLDPDVFLHRWVGRSDGLAHIDVVIGHWCIRHDVALWHPSPSLVQHIGEVSSLWVDAAAEGDRRADWFAGD